MKEAVVRIARPTYRKKDGLSYLTYRGLSHTNLLHGLIVFKDLSLRLDYEHWFGAVSQKVAKILYPQPFSLVVPKQIHSGIIRSVSSKESPVGITADGLVVDEPRLMIGVSVADCVPLFAVNMLDRVLGIAHCGWRGVISGIVEEFFSALSGKIRRHGETDFLIGASIGSCCYEVGQELLGSFSDDEARIFSEPRHGKAYFDLKRLVASRLTRLGVDPQKISIDNTCTSCQKYMLASYRGSGGQCGRMLAFAMLAE